MKIRWILAVAVVGCGSGGDKPTPAAGQIQITVTDKGFEPDPVTVPHGIPVTLVFTRKTETTCAKDVVMEVAGQKVQKPLPLNQPVPIAVTFPEAGTLTYSCDMDMIKAHVTVQ
jgi:plastocyanin domain-containing protein